MSEADQKASELEARLDRLVKTQIDFQREISAIRAELARLKVPASDAGPSSQYVPPVETVRPPRASRPPIRPIEQPLGGFVSQYSKTRETEPLEPVSDFFSKHTEAAQSNLEKFIGENLISKIGILVLIIGIGIGVKYSIDNNLISPLTRIIFAYLFAFGLIGLAIKLKPKYLNFSAVLISGGMATMYFVTYFAHTAYGLIGQAPAFGLMVMCTVFTVVAALFYNRQVIAHIGLVGAYAVPFLLSRDSGSYLALFAYVTIINMGILAVSIKKYWPSIVYTASLFTWLIYGAWFLTRYRGDEHFAFALSFAAVFFATLYASSLIHRVLNQDIGKVGTNGLVIANSFVFYGFGYAVLNDNESTAGLLGLYTAANSAVHLGVAFVIGRMKNAPTDIVLTLTLLVLTFATIAIPVQFDGNYVTLGWSVEAVILFWFGRVQKIRAFELSSYPVMALAVGSMFLDWVMAYANRTLGPSEFNLQPFANGNFVTGVVFIAAFALIYAINRDTSKESEISPGLVKPFGYAVVTIALAAFYNLYRTEIDNYFHLLAVDAIANGFGVSSPEVRDVYIFSAIWQVNYTMAFFTAMAFVNSFKAKSYSLAIVNSILGVCTLWLFATIVMVLFYDLRVDYLGGQGSIWNVWIRYFSYPFAALLFLGLHRYTRDEWMPNDASRQLRTYLFEVVAYSFCFIVASCELLNLMAQFGIPDGTKLGLSIFWGIYALMLVVIGIGWNRKHLRVSAIALLAVTLAKLFFYDIADLDTIPRTILFVTLGLTLLLISFLYNKYKNAIFGFAGESEE